MNATRNEVEPSDTTDFGAKPPMGFTITLLSLFHVLCCGLPLLLLSGVSFPTLFRSWPVIGAVMAVLGVLGFVWYLRKGCATCPGKLKRGGAQSDFSAPHEERAHD